MHLLCLVLGHKFALTGGQNILGEPFVYCTRCTRRKIVRKPAR